jgi:hypothetical protein
LVPAARFILDRQDHRGYLGHEAGPSAEMRPIISAADFIEKTDGAQILFV